MDAQFSRTQALLGRAAMERLKKARVAVFGLGGVGGYALEALARSGVGKLALFDHDTLSLTNLNRQILATHATVGRPKVEVAKERVQAICPDTAVECYPMFYGPDTADEIDLTRFDYIIDAIDTVTAKLCLISRAMACGTPIISCMGTGNKLDGTAVQVSDISKTAGCPLARVMRKELRHRGIHHLKVVWSAEEPIAPAGMAEEAAALGKRQIPGSMAVVPGVAGLILAGEVIRDLTK